MANVVRMGDGTCGSLVSTDGDKGKQGKRMRRTRHTMVTKMSKNAEMRDEDGA
jgi:hypothetical protein